MAKVGIKDIAAEAGVSIATVSHAMRNPGRVSDSTRKKVLAAADRVGYTPNKAAVSLRTARSGNIVVIIPDISVSHNSKIIKSIEQVALSRGYSVLLGDTQGSKQRERQFAAMTDSGQADGVILMSHRLPFGSGNRPLAGDELPPIVNGCEFTGHDNIPCVTIDDERAAEDATDHLLDYGHREIAVITGNMNSTSSKRRLQGYRKAMRRAGLEVNEQYVVGGAYTLAAGESAANRLLQQKARPSAIFCFSDEIALGCMHALRQNGFSVPNDISVMGFDDIPFARYFSPPLTTIAQPTDEIGAACATLLLDLIEGKQPGQMKTVLDHKLLVRESTRRLD